MGDENQILFVRQNLDLVRGQYGLWRALLLRLLRRLKLFPFIFDYPYVHPPVMVQMVGRKTRPQASAE